MNKKDIEGWLEAYQETIRSMDTERWVAHYAEDATAEDPVGGPVHKGAEALTQFFDGVKKFSKQLDMQPKLTVISPPEAVVNWTVTNTTVKGVDITFDGIGYYKFNEGGKLVQMRAFWDPETIGK